MTDGISWLRPANATFLAALPLTVRLWSLRCLNVSSILSRSGDLDTSYLPRGCRFLLSSVALIGDLSVASSGMKDVLLISVRFNGYKLPGVARQLLCFDMRRLSAFLTVWCGWLNGFFFLGETKSARQS